jgi:hypothetical protein
MRALLVVVFAGCVVQGSRSDDPGGWVFPDGTAGHCQSDSACTGGKVCARDGGCWSPSEVHAAHVSWTLRGMPASLTTCEATPELQIGFYPKGTAQELGYAPVPCVAGKFTVDKLPVTYTGVKLGRATSDHRWESTTIDGVTGDATIDLPF